MLILSASLCMFLLSISLSLQRLAYLHDPEFTSDILECLGLFAVSISMQLRKRCDAGAMGAITLLKLWPSSVKSWIMWPRTAKQLFAFQCNSILRVFLHDYLISSHLMICRTQSNLSKSHCIRKWKLTVVLWPHWMTFPCAGVCFPDRPSGTVAWLH